MTDLRKAAMDYLDWMGQQGLDVRMKNQQAYNDVADNLLNGEGVLELRSSSEVSAVRSFLWGYQWRRCAISGTALPYASAILEHDHRSTLVRSVADRCWNQAEAGYYVGKVRRLSRAYVKSRIATYLKTHTGYAVSYPEKLTAKAKART